MTLFQSLVLLRNLQASSDFFLFAFVLRENFLPCEPALAEDAAVLEACALFSLRNRMVVGSLG